MNPDFSLSLHAMTNGDRAIKKIHQASQTYGERNVKIGIQRQGEDSIAAMPIPT
jgi:hypothetical protein